ncbi:hypothetical protein [Planomonospora venezuelensis]|uniref:Uncharacterized protein n=1 Tax=Planomonospora venezuelensis TaxID=1999 RepID=A0A841DAT9_PLAVE|nr:hypothetical protein [Planomonospora venezuelensis]MBB5965953.1 hypothetical protein [Planomonospora venezuelensis]GIN01293.1 hypothetical protein Pve01_29510 [Planomonospora venezuelensis]
MVFVDSCLPADGEAFVSAWPDGGAAVKAPIAEPAVLSRPLGELPATYVQCLPAGAAPGDDVAELPTGRRWRLVGCA